MQNAQPTTNCAKWILKVDYLSISKQQKNFGVSKMQGRVTIGHMATRLICLVCDADRERQVVRPYPVGVVRAVDPAAVRNGYSQRLRHLTFTIVF